MNSNQIRKSDGFDGQYFYLDFIDELVKEMQLKAFRVQAKLDSFSKAETFAYWILKERGYFDETLTTEEIEAMKSLSSTSPASSSCLTSRTSPTS